MDFRLEFQSEAEQAADCFGYYLSSLARKFFIVVPIPTMFCRFGGLGGRNQLNFTSLPQDTEIRIPIGGQPHLSYQKLSLRIVKGTFI
ncbi:MAG: hypothetical protein F6J98_30765 [Moorea sp. SIO4G2]|nr:hypothetical protein [Moorena sp. SIO4G2]